MATLGRHREYAAIAAGTSSKRASIENALPLPSMAKYPEPHGSSDSFVNCMRLRVVVTAKSAAEIRFRACDQEKNPVGLVMKSGQSFGCQSETPFSVRECNRRERQIQQEVGHLQETLTSEVHSPIFHYPVSGAKWTYRRQPRLRFRSSRARSKL